MSTWESPEQQRREIAELYDQLGRPKQAELLRHVAETSHEEPIRHASTATVHGLPRPVQDGPGV